MQLIVGLGNPGAKYNFTRHNFGFLALDFYAKLHALTWQKPKFHAAWLQTDGKIFIKPQDYYNLSGRAVQEFALFIYLFSSDFIMQIIGLSVKANKIF